MSIHQRVFAPFYIKTSEEDYAVDINSLVMRLLLFDHYTIDSPLMRDLALITQNFGIQGAEDLLKSGVISIHTDAISMAIMERTDELGHRKAVNYQTNQLLPYNHYDPIVIQPADRDDYLESGFSNIDKLSFSSAELSSYKNAILDTVIKREQSIGMVPEAKEAIGGSNEIAKSAVLLALSDRGHAIPNPAALQVTFYLDGPNIISAESNIRELVAMNNYEQHKVLESAILKIYAYFQRIGLMKEYNSIAWFNDQDSTLLRKNVQLISDTIASNTQEEQFTRIVELKNLPLLDNEQQIDVHQLLRLRDSRECKEFREWLKTNDAKSDADILAEVNSLRQAFARALTSRRSKTARFIMAGAIGTVNPAAGAILGAVDFFLIDELLKESGPISFINNSLPELAGGNL